MPSPINIAKLPTHSRSSLVVAPEASCPANVSPRDAPLECESIPYRAQYETFVRPLRPERNNLRSSAKRRLSDDFSKNRSDRHKRASRAVGDSHTRHSSAPPHERWRLSSQLDNVSENLQDQSINELFREFRNSEELDKTLSTFDQLVVAAGFDHDDFTQGRVRPSNIFTELARVCNSAKVNVEMRNGAMSRCPGFDGQLVTLGGHRIFSRLVKRRERYLDESPVEAQTHALIVGAGPVGLCSAIELALMGAERVTVVEKRPYLSRNNVLHVWKSCIHHLREFGVKFFTPHFCSGGIDHVAIKSLQMGLLKIALLCGVRVVFGASFDNFDPNHLVTAVNDRGDSLWFADISLNTKSLQARVPQHLANCVWGPEDRAPTTVGRLFGFNVLLGADGQNSHVARVLNFERKVFQAARCLGVTGNFVKTNAKEEQSLREFGFVRYAKPAMFNRLATQKGADLENVVYYRDRTHYFVMTATKESLLARGVLREPKESKAELLSPTNVDRQKTVDFVRDVAVIAAGVPESCEPALEHNGQPDFAVFDFTCRRSAVTPSRVYCSKDSYGRPARLVCALVGDALLEPFWPLGTGVSRGIYGMWDALHLVRRVIPAQSCDDEQLLNALREHNGCFSLLMSLDQGGERKPFGQHAVDPRTRYSPALGSASWQREIDSSQLVRL